MLTFALLWYTTRRAFIHSFEERHEKIHLWLDLLLIAVGQGLPISLFLWEFLLNILTDIQLLICTVGLPSHCYNTSGLI
jgi:hypothetical protein